jgi:hypothetical protein
VAELCGKLDAAAEGSGTVLDNTVILVMSDMSEGAERDVRRIPYVIVGSAGGFFNPRGPSPSPAGSPTTSC